jgi:hypothetical protein
MRRSAARRKSLVEARIIESPAVALEREPFLCCVARLRKRQLSHPFVPRSSSGLLRPGLAPHDTQPGSARLYAAAPLFIQLEHADSMALPRHCRTPSSALSEYQNVDIIYQCRLEAILSRIAETSTQRRSCLWPRPPHESRSRAVRRPATSCSGHRRCRSVAAAAIVRNRGKPP